MKFIDSNIIAYAFYENELQRQCQNAVREGGIVNVLVLAEAFNIIEYHSSRTYATQAIRSLIKSSLHIISVDQEKSQHEHKKMVSNTSALASLGIHWRVDLHSSLLVLSFCLLSHV